MVRLRSAERHVDKNLLRVLTVADAHVHARAHQRLLDVVRKKLTYLYMRTYILTSACLKTSYRKNWPAMMAPDHKHRDGSPRKSPATPKLRVM